MGIDALREASRLVDAAAAHEPTCILRNEIHRVAQTERNASQLRKTAQDFPEYATWRSGEEVEESCGARSTLGGVVLANGCRVIHVPSYLRGLWRACEDVSGGTIEWLRTDSATPSWEDLSDFDAVVLSAGSGIIRDEIVGTALPAHLVRGQSVEMTMPPESDFRCEATLCGKYIAPLPESRRIVIGATHEFGDALSESDVVEELRSRSYELSPQVWDEGVVDKITTGIRVQSQRGMNGRMPMVGRIEAPLLHTNAWLFTGLSSRGLVHHGIFGKMLGEAVLSDDEEDIRRTFDEFDWWKKVKSK